MRARRLAQAENDPAFSLRKVAGRVGIEPSYLSKIERGEEPPPGEQTIRRIAEEMGETPMPSSHWPERFRAICSKSSANVPPSLRNFCARCGACPPNECPKSPAGFAMANGEPFPEPGNTKLTIKPEHDRRTFTFPEIAGPKRSALDGAYTMYHPPCR